VSRDASLYLDDMLEACRRVISYSQDLSREAFLSDLKTRDAVIRNLELLGEASKQVPPDIQALAPNVPWRRIAGLRDVLIHAYFGIDDDILWDVVDVKVPELLPQLEQLADRHKAAQKP
jgi:uncharacterized protein with HEPN domain